MSILMEALRLHKPLPATWPQVPLRSESQRGTKRLQWPAGLPGYGDAATWPPFDGHPNDPRGGDDPVHALTIEALEDVISALRRARDDVRRADDWTETAAALVRDAIEALTALEVES